MKKAIAFACIAILMFVFCSCDEGLRYCDIEVLDLPTKLVYTSEDTELDLSGGAVRLTVLAGRTSIVMMDAYPMASENEHGVYSNVDFGKPGVYEVTITQYDDIKCSFEIEVVP